MVDLVLGDDTQRYVWMPVTVNVAVDGGKTHKIKFKAKLLDPGQDRCREIFESTPNDGELIAEVLDGWKSITGITAKGGSEIDYNNQEHREGFLDFTGVESAIATAWIDMVRKNKGRRKN